MERRRARPICLMGPAGVGKTEIVRQAAKENDLAFLSYSITHHTRQSIIGLPRLIEGEAGGKACSMTEYTMSEIIAQVYRTMEESGKKEGILFLDEFNCASESLRPIMLQLLQDKSFGPHAIPDGWMLVLAGNPTEYNHSATDLDAVTADRMRLLHIEPDYKAWRSYIIQHNVHPLVLSYLDHHKEHFYICRHTEEGTALATARGWEDLSLMMNYLEDAGEGSDLPLIAQFIQAKEAAQSFYQYYSQYRTSATDNLAKQIMAKQPKAVAALQKMNGDRLWCLVAALLRRFTTEAQIILEDDAQPELEKALFQKVSNMMLVCRKVMEGKPPYIFMVEYLLQSQAAKDLMENSRHADFRQFFSEISAEQERNTSNLFLCAR